MSRLLKNDRSYRLAIVVVALVFAVITGFELRHSMSVAANDLSQATTLNGETDQVNSQVAIGKAVAEHQGAALNHARRLSQRIPPVVDDRSILESVVRATEKTGTTLSSESRGHPSAGDGVSTIPVGMTVNGPNMSAVLNFPSQLQQQARLFTVTGLTFGFVNGAQVQVVSSAYADSGAKPPAIVNGASP